MNSAGHSLSVPPARSVQPSSSSTRCREAAAINDGASMPGAACSAPAGSTSARPTIAAASGVGAAEVDALISLSSSVLNRDKVLLQEHANQGANHSFIEPAGDGINEVADRSRRFFFQLLDDPLHAPREPASAPAAAQLDRLPIRIAGHDEMSTALQ